VKLYCMGENKPGQKRTSNATWRGPRLCYAGSCPWSGRERQRASKAWFTGAVKYMSSRVQVGEERGEMNFRRMMSVVDGRRSGDQRWSSVTPLIGP